MTTPKIGTIKEIETTDKWRWLQKYRDLIHTDGLKYENYRKIKDDPKYEDDLRNEDNIKEAIEIKTNTAPPLQPLSQQFSIG